MASGGQLRGQCPWPSISMRARSALHGNRFPHRAARSLGRSAHLSSHRWWRARAGTHARTHGHARSGRLAP